MSARPESDVTAANGWGGAMADLAKFAALHLGAGDDKPSLLKSETLKRLHTPPETHDKYRYFAGWFTVEAQWSNGPALMHPGITPWSYCLVWIAPARHSAVIVATTMGPPRGKRACDDIVERLAKQFFPEARAR